jgi:hypothetical protein
MPLTAEQKDQITQSAKSIEDTFNKSFNEEIIPLVKLHLTYDDEVSVAVHVVPNITEGEDGSIDIANTVDYKLAFATDATDDEAEQSKQQDFDYVFSQVLNSMYQ